MKALPRAILALSDGRVFRGRAIGALARPGAAVHTGEVVFNTAMTGYQEILTDPSYRGQFVLMTAPQIGNYGVNPEDVESHRPWAAGFLLRELSPMYSNWRADRGLDDYMAAHQIPGIDGIDTRALTRHLREEGAMMAALGPASEGADALVDRARAAGSMEGRDLASEVTCERPYLWNDGGRQDLAALDEVPGHGERPRVLVWDFGVKYNILRQFYAVGAEVIVLPASTSAEAALALDPAGLFLSNGPGDPAAVGYAVETTRALLGQRPLFGICLGHQILGLAAGGRTYKLKFGHHGANHPVQHVDGGRVEITSQNHGFAVDVDSIAKAEGVDARLSWRNLNDGTVEGIELPGADAVGIQYHPEANPGPHDAAHHIRRFVERLSAQGGR